VQVERAIHVTVFNLGVYCKSWAFEEIIEHYRSVSRPQLPTKKYINIRDKQDFYEQLLTYVVKFGSQFALPS